MRSRQQRQARTIGVVVALFAIGLAIVAIKLRNLPAATQRVTEAAIEHADTVDQMLADPGRSALPTEQLRSIVSAHGATIRDLSSYASLLSAGIGKLSSLLLILSGLAMPLALWLIARVGSGGPR